MTRYYFDVQRGDKVITDREGLELSTIDVAEQEAVGAAAIMARDAIRRSSNPYGNRSQGWQRATGKGQILLDC